MMYFVSPKLCSPQMWSLFADDRVNHDDKSDNRNNFKIFHLESSLFFRRLQSIGLRSQQYFPINILIHQFVIDALLGWDMSMGVGYALPLLGLTPRSINFELLSENHHIFSIKPGDCQLFQLLEQGVDVDFAHCLLRARNLRSLKSKTPSHNTSIYLLSYLTLMNIKMCSHSFLAWR